MSSPTYHATLTQTPPLAVESFRGFERKTPGDVGICLSGGGSRALSAGMGQLRALKHLQANGASLLSQVKAVSTVSGGSWLGVTFEYLTGSVSDDDFLNGYVSNPADLVPSHGPSVAVTLDELPRGNIGHACNSVLFSIGALAVEAFLLWKVVDTPPDMLWQTLMGIHILLPYGLYRPGENALPTSYFTLNEVTRDAIIEKNPSLRYRPAALFADATDKTRTRRPYLICNTAMFVHLADGTKLLAPVQAGAFFTGIVGRPDAYDHNDQTVGGGGVTSFAFNSRLHQVNGREVEVDQSRQWSLTDIIGASSAYYAETVREGISDPEKLHKHMVKFGKDVGENLKRLFPEARSRIDALTVEPRALELLKDDVSELHLHSLIPHYDYWPVLCAQPDSKSKKSGFADGGSLENTGIASMLGYADIRSIIAFVNSENRLKSAHKGVMVGGKEVPDTRILVDDQIPPLFGYQPYTKKSGYVPFGESGAADESPPSQVKVFDPEQFPALLRGLWKASGSGAHSAPANFRQHLVTQANDWFGVAGNRKINVLWVYLNPVSGWVDLLKPEVQALVSATDHFPNYKTIATDLRKTQINLLANLAAWCVGDPAHASAFTELFSG